MSAEAQTVVLIHGMWMTPRSWDDWVDHYRDHGHQATAHARATTTSEAAVR